MNRNYYLGEIVNNNDPLKRGRVQVRVEFIHSGVVNDELLPWVFADNSKSSFIPEVGDIYYIYFVDSFYKKGFYTNKLDYQNYNEQAYYYSELKNSVGSNSEYPNMKFEKYKNGAVIGVDSSKDNPEIVIYHPKGSYVFIDSNGKFELKTDGVSLKDLLIGLVDDLINFKTFGSPTNHTTDPSTVVLLNNYKNNELPKFFK